jgi:hypothetical protein
VEALAATKNAFEKRNGDAQWGAGGLSLAFEGGGAVGPAVEGGGVMLRREVEEARRLLDVERETVGAVGEEVRAAREVVE